MAKELLFHHSLFARANRISSTEEALALSSVRDVRQTATRRKKNRNSHEICISVRLYCKSKMEKKCRKSFARQLGNPTEQKNQGVRNKLCPFTFNSFSCCRFPSCDIRFHQLWPWHTRQMGAV